MNFTMKEFYKGTFNKYDVNKNPVLFLLGNMLSGGLAGGTSLMIMYPFEFVRTRLAMDIGKTMNEREFKGILDVC